MTLELNVSALWPVLAPALAAVAVLVLDVVWPRARTTHLWLAALGLVGGGVAAAPLLAQAPAASEGAFCLPNGPCLYAASSLTGSLQLLALASALVVLVLTWREWGRADRSGAEPADRATAPTVVQVALFLAATAGVVAVPAARDLGSLLVALELATLPVVGLVALERRASRHAGAVAGAVALLTTSLVSFALLALGAAMWVAATGTGLLSPVAAAEAAAVPERAPLLLLSAVFLLAGLGFKLSAIPFHAWTPLTYSAAPLAITTFLAGTSKVAALGGMIVLVQGLSGTSDFALIAVAVLAAVSMTLGNAMALRQEDLIHLLAWSAIAQAGWLLLPLASLSSRAAHAAGGYLVVYVTATVLAFVIVFALAGVVGGTRLEHHRHLGRHRPFTAAALGMALLTLAGLPPAIVGLVAKVVVLRPVAADGTWWLIVVAALNIALGIAVYLRWLAVLIQRDEAADLRAAEAEAEEVAAARAAAEPAAAEATAPVPSGDAEATTAIPTSDAEATTPVATPGTEATTVIPTKSPATGADGADSASGDPAADPASDSATEEDAEPRPTPLAVHHRVMIGVLTALLVLGSIAPVGIF